MVLQNLAFNNLKNYFVYFNYSLYNTRFFIYLFIFFTFHFNIHSLIFFILSTSLSLSLLWTKINQIPTALPPIPTTSHHNPAIATTKYPLPNSLLDCLAKYTIASPDKNNPWCCPASNSKPPPPPTPPPPSPPPHCTLNPNLEPESSSSFRIQLFSGSLSMDFTPTSTTTTTTTMNGHYSFLSSFTKFNSTLTVGLLYLMSLPPLPHKNRSSPTLSEMMASELDIHPIPLSQIPQYQNAIEERRDALGGKRE